MTKKRKTSMNIFDTLYKTQLESKLVATPSLEKPKKRRQSAQICQKLIEKGLKSSLIKNNKDMF